jgi:hypothetical protein
MKRGRKEETRLYLFTCSRESERWFLFLKRKKRQKKRERKSNYGLGGG